MDIYALDLYDICLHICLQILGYHWFHCFAALSVPGNRLNQSYIVMVSNKTSCPNSIKTLITCKTYSRQIAVVEYSVSQLHHWWTWMTSLSVENDMTHLPKNVICCQRGDCFRPWNRNCVAHVCLYHGKLMQYQRYTIRKCDGACNSPKDRKSV